MSIIRRIRFVQLQETRLADARGRYIGSLLKILNTRNLTKLIKIFKNDPIWLEHHWAARCFCHFGIEGIEAMVPASLSTEQLKHKTAIIVVLAEIILRRGIKDFGIPEEIAAAINYDFGSGELTSFAEAKIASLMRELEPFAAINALYMISVTTDDHEALNLVVSSIAARWLGNTPVFMGLQK